MSPCHLPYTTKIATTVDGAVSTVGSHRFRTSTPSAARIAAAHADPPISMAIPAASHHAGAGGTPTAHGDEGAAYTHMCVCVCVFECVYVSMLVCESMSVCVYVYVCVWVCGSVCMCVCLIYKGSCTVSGQPLPPPFTNRYETNAVADINRHPIDTLSDTLSDILSDALSDTLIDTRIETLQTL